MDTSGWFDDLPVIGKLPPEQAIIKLREVGEDDVADMLEMTQEAETKAFRSSDFRSWLHLEDRPWELLHDEQGFLALRTRNPITIVRRLPKGGTGRMLHAL